MNKNDFIFVIDPEETMTIIDYKEIAQIRILWISEHQTFYLAYLPAKLTDYYILYESKDNDEIVAAKEYLFECILKKRFCCDFSSNKWR